MAVGVDVSVVVPVGVWSLVCVSPGVDDSSWLVTVVLVVELVIGSELEVEPVVSIQPPALPPNGKHLYHIPRVK